MSRNRLADEHPFLAQMMGEPGQARVAAERREHDLVGGDHHQPDDRDAHRVAVQDGDADQHGGEQHEVDRNAEQAGKVG